MHNICVIWKNYDFPSRKSRVNTLNLSSVAYDMHFGKRSALRHIEIVLETNFLGGVFCIKKRFDAIHMEIYRQKYSLIKSKF